MHGSVDAYLSSQGLQGRIFDNAPLSQKLLKWLSSHVLVLNSISVLSEFLDLSVLCDPRWNLINKVEKGSRSWAIASFLELQ